MQISKLLLQTLLKLPTQDIRAKGKYTDTCPKQQEIISTVELKMFHFSSAFLYDVSYCAV